MDVKKAVDEAASLVMIKSPFIGSLLFRVKVVAAPPHAPFIAAVDKHGVVYINPDKFLKYSVRDRAITIAHEVLHAALRHPERAEKVEHPRVYNKAADVIVDEALVDDDFKYERYPVDKAEYYAEIGDPNEIKRWAVEKLYKEMLKHAHTIKIPLLALTSGEDSAGDGNEDGGGGGQEDNKSGWSGDFVEPMEGEVIRAGDPRLYDENADEAELTDRWRGAVEAAKMAAKSAGKEPVGLLREIEAFLKPKLNWRSLLRAAISSGLQKHVSTWKRPSRKHVSFPGYRKYGCRRVFALVDTSGSISEGELRDFLSEIYGAARLSQVLVRCWDADVYEKVQVNKPADAARLAKKMRGGGGTVITPALSATLKEMRGGDVVVVFTDGYLFDEDAAQPLFSAVASRGKAIVVTTDKEVRAPGWTQIRL